MTLSNAALNGITAGDPTGDGDVKAFVLNFGDETGITTTDCTDSTDKAGAWYDMSGRKLSGKPTKRGVYVNNGRKIVIK